MDINELGVFNELHKLGLTDKNFKAIAEEQSHTERSGLSIVVVNENAVICVSHDDDDKILIRKHSDFKRKVKSKSRILFKTLVTFSDLPEEIYTLHSIAEYRALDKDINYVAKNIEQLKDRVCDRFIDRYPKTLGEMYWEHDKKNKKDELIVKQLKAIFWLFGEDFKKFKWEQPRPKGLYTSYVYEKTGKREIGRTSK